MRNWDDYQELYNTEDNWYLEYVDGELKKIRRKYNENKMGERKIR